ncbi:hypothetical protein DPMN_051011 [Dreissena polymorpha]|uniref:Uncharacterized protein n=1 Tax=Dreissena polymorpha TaxID=45954 RepID=A0A9D4CI90_DREPO|nr:hypothetical protein DPMN_051011 [Dreissena polymorpha]
MECVRVKADLVIDSALGSNQNQLCAKMRVQSAAHTSKPEAMEADTGHRSSGLED